MLTGAAIRGKLLLGCAAIVFVALPSAFANAQEVVTPANGDYYTIDTYFTGACAPEGELPAPVDNGRASSTYTQTLFQHDSYSDRNMIPGDDGLGDPRGFQAHDGACEGTDLTSIGGRVLQGGPINPFEPGKWRMDSTTQVVPFECCAPPCSEDPSCQWEQVGAEESLLYAAADFTVYNPCVYTVRSVKGVAVVHRVGTSGSIPLREGSIVGDGDVLEVRDRGRLALEGGNGVTHSVLAGKYSLGSRRACTSLGRPLPKTSPPPKIEEGGIIQRSKSEFDAIIRGGKDLKNDGQYSRLRTPESPAAEEIAFKVTRSKRRGITKSCAIEGGLRVYTTNRAVPPKKRSVTLETGECAVTRDGKAPKVRR